MTLQITSRYDALGQPNGCYAQCEGTGWIPVNLNDSSLTAYEREQWEKAHQVEQKAGRDCDGWHFVPCEKCNKEKAL